MAGNGLLDREFRASRKPIAGERRMSKTVAIALLITVALVALLLLLMPRASAEDTAAAESTQHDLGTDHFAAGGTVSVATPVTGDAIVAGGEIEVRADVGGDLIVAGGSVRIDGPVKQGLYAAGGRVSINAPVARNVRAAAGRIEVGPGARIGGNASLAGGEVRVLGAVDGYLQARGGRLLIDAPVAGDAELGGDRIELGPHARVAGKLRYASRNDLQRDPAAEVQGGIERVTAAGGWPAAPRLEHRAWRRGGGFWSLGLMALAALLAGALPAFFTRVADTVHSRWGWSLLIGFIGLVCIPAAVLLLAITIIGIPVALASAALYLVLLLVGYVSAAVAAGELALRRLAPERATRNGWRAAAAALVMLCLTLLARVPLIGRLAVLAALLTGIGALLLQLGGRAAGPGAPVAATS
jgi:cytoskeletal protein CcmA (bactofilin family)